jgi:Ca2+-binding EF-hand superfamily protein
MMVKRAADRMERRLDVNGDGKISLEAIEKHRTARFAELDKNKDGKLDRSELKAGKHHGKGEQRHKGKDHGKHTPAE